MAKDPAVLFYTSDFISGTSFLTMEQRGQYITLLCQQHQLGAIPSNHMISICGSIDSPVIEKFVKNENGDYFNERMREEAEKRKNFCKSRSNNKSGRKKGKNKSSDISSDSTYDKSYDSKMITHMENENENTNTINNNSINTQNSDFTPPKADPFFQELENDITKICNHLKTNWKSTETYQKNFERVTELITHRSITNIVTAIDNALLIFDNDGLRRQYRPAFKNYFNTPADIDKLQERPKLTPKKPTGAERTGVPEKGKKYDGPTITHL